MAEQAALFPVDFEGRGHAEFSECGRYRYTLSRVWGERGGIVNWLMLNPSTADAFRPDPTITRCINFSKAWGFHGLIVTNIFALRSTDPKMLKRVSDPVGDGNDDFISHHAQSVDLVICAWGNGSPSADRPAEVRRLLASVGCRPMALHVLESGNLQHPLYVRGDTQPVAFGWEVAR